MDPDRLAGMILYGALGDAIGAPWELRYKPKAPSSYQGSVDGTLIHTIKIGKYHSEPGELPYKEYPAGTVTDDTTMTQTLLVWLDNCNWKPVYSFTRGMVVCDVILAYMHWAKTCPFLGNNTRKLLKVENPSMAMYQRRWEKHEHASGSLGNGCIMRAPPLALVHDDNFIIADCSITNNNDISRLCTVLYVMLLRQALSPDKPSLTSWLLQQEHCRDLINSAYQTAMHGAPVPLQYSLSAKYMEQHPGLSPTGPWKGSVMAAIWASAYAVFRLEAMTFLEKSVLSAGVHMIFHELISFKGDTDSDCKIAGAVIGARMGWQYLSQHQSYNISVLFQQQPWLVSCTDHEVWKRALAAMSA